MHLHRTLRSAPFHPRIHVFGNVGMWGNVHAEVAWATTRLIDLVAYKGRNVRKEIATEMAALLDTDSHVLEVGCGVGTFTHELVEAGFHNLTAIDTSEEMLAVARRNVPSASFLRMNAADVVNGTDVALVSMVCHELPKEAHEELLRTLSDSVWMNKGELWIIDIDPSFQPSPSMLYGEPYVTEYLQTIDGTISRFARVTGMQMRTFTILSEHVRGWVLKA